jgi:methylglutaconyl-CoA hydratase
MKEGYVKTETKNGISEITFYHPKSNSLPGYLLDALTDAFIKMSTDKNSSVIILRSEGNGAFCAGASFDELLSLKDFNSSKKFFAGFANVINAMRKSPKFVLARVHGKIVGGGVGLTAASDYAIAHKSSAIRLSELTLSIGPFVIGPAVERKIGRAAYQNLTIDSEWRSADWGLQKGLYAKVVDSFEELDKQIYALAERLSQLNPETITDMKNCFWEGTENWDELLERRAEISGHLVLTDFTKNYIKNFIQQRKKK